MFHLRNELGVLQGLQFHYVQSGLATWTQTLIESSEMRTSTSQLPPRF